MINNILKTYQQFINESNIFYKKEEDNTHNVYYGNDGKDGYIFVLDKSGKLEGFAKKDKNVVVDEDGEEIYLIDTIYGPGIGDYLYSGFISKFGRICPNYNMSDNAKKSWRRRIENKDGFYLISKSEGIGFYHRYPEEDYLNSVIDLSSKNKVNVTDYKGDKRIYDEIHRLYNMVVNELKNSKYTIGESTIRDQYLEDDGMDPNDAPYLG